MIFMIRFGISLWVSFLKPFSSKTVQKMDEAEETENDFSFNFLDFVDQELEDNVNDEDSNSFVDLEFVSDEENEPENYNQSVISMN